MLRLFVTESKMPQQQQQFQCQLGTRAFNAINYKNIYHLLLAILNNLIDWLIIKKISHFKQV